MPPCVWCVNRGQPWPRIGVIGWVVGRPDGVPRWPVWPKGGDFNGWSDSGQERHTANPRGPVAESPKRTGQPKESLSPTGAVPARLTEKASPGSTYAPPPPSAIPNSKRELEARTRFEFTRAKRKRTPAGGYGGVRALRVQLEARAQNGVNSERSEFAALRVRGQ